MKEKWTYRIFSVNYPKACKTSPYAIITSNCTLVCNEYAEEVWKVN